jgi:hypothetical protein
MTPAPASWFPVSMAVLLLAGPAEAAPQRAKFTSPAGSVIIELLDDDLVHVEFSAVDEGPPTDRPLHTSPMVLKTDRGGATDLAMDGNLIETPDLRIRVERLRLCLRLEDRTSDDRHLATLCPADLGQPFKRLDINPARVRHAYGLGQKFKRLGSADGPRRSRTVGAALDRGRGRSAGEHDLRLEVPAQARGRNWRAGLAARRRQSPTTSSGYAGQARGAF